MATSNRYKLVFFVPLPDLARCKVGIFDAGGGRYPGAGKYTEVCWIAIGTGQFRPGDSASPHIGIAGKLEEVQEARVEILCVGDDVTRKAVAALKDAHPYEEPAYEVYKLENF